MKTLSKVKSAETIRRVESLTADLSTITEAQTLIEQ